MPSGTELPEREKGMILGLKAAGKTNVAIAKELNRSEKAVRNFFKDPEGLNRRPQTGRPKSLSPRDQRSIFRLAYKCAEVLQLVLLAVKVSRSRASPISRLV
ncbi:TPA: hypothetical protein N0F65_010087 [Lagenidium giganteum]|uniref:Tc3 transposase DNA binding domain-containing protein n=1 Tax=Lagenidium giganteum TaxID=4803 RepID=A0AAV2YL96_9STRA|nr:TPA: hypothetical protein N0F65_010087 [Lagenidium giganteum]